MTVRGECPATAHGTSNGYKNYACRCPECREAWRIYMKRLRARRDQGITWRIPAELMIRRVRALQAIGWSQQYLAERLGLQSSSSLRQSMRHPTVTMHTFRPLDALYQELCDKPGPSQQTRGMALARGYLPPAAWENINDLNERPHVEAVDDREWMDEVAVDEAMRGRAPRLLTYAERREVVRRMNLAGHLDRFISEQTGIPERRVYEIRHDELGLPSRYDQALVAAERKGLLRGA